MKKVLLIFVMIFCFNITNVYAQDTSIDLDNTEEKEVENETIIQEINDINSNSLNNLPNSTDQKIVEESDKINSSSIINNKDSNEYMESNDRVNNSSVINGEDCNENDVENKDEVPTLDELNKIDDKLEFKDELLIVKGNLFDYTSISLINGIMNKKEIVSNYNLIIQFIDKSCNSIDEDKIINDEIYLVLKNDTFEMKFKITFLFDFDENYIVNDEDKIKLLELMSEDSTIIESENLSYFDYALKNKTYDVPVRESISLDMEITTDKEYYDYQDEFDVIIANTQPPVENRVQQETDNNLVVEDIQSSITDSEDNLEKDPIEEEKPSEDDEEDKKIYINIISGKIDYDHNALKLLSIRFDDYKNLSTEEDSYLFWVDNLETIRIVFRFKVINQNSTEYITIHDVDICSEGKIIQTQSMRAKVGLNKISVPVYSNKKDIINKTSKIEEKEIIREKRTNSFASKINIKNHLIEFNYLVKKYIVKADYSETSLDFDIILGDKEYASYRITGNSNFKVGENLVMVTVTAEDGSTTDYEFSVIRMPKNNIRDKKNNNVGYDLLSMNIFLGFLIVAIGFIYILFSYRFKRY